jgi:hypothetical protein
MPWMTCSGPEMSDFGSTVGNSKAHSMIGSGLWPGALGGTRTPNLLIRSHVQDVQPVRPDPFPQARVHRVSSEDARVRCRPTSL